MFEIRNIISIAFIYNYLFCFEYELHASVKSYSNNNLAIKTNSNLIPISPI